MLASNPCYRTDEQQKVAFVKCQVKKHQRVSEEQSITGKTGLNSAKETGTEQTLTGWEDQMNGSEQEQQSRGIAYGGSEKRGSTAMYPAHARGHAQDRVTSH